MALVPAEPCPQPKLLSYFTVPAGGWQLKLYLSASAQYDTPVTCTVPAGDYVMAWDAQSTDFLWKLVNVLQTAITALGSPFNAGTALVAVMIDATTHKVRIGFDHTFWTTATRRQVKIAWTELDGPDIAKVLGFDESADDASTATNNPVFTADYHHAYGWYADDDGLVEGDLAEDESIPEVQQSVSPASGHVHSHYVGSRFANMLKLVYLPRLKTFSRDVGYTAASAYPFERNEPLECWWKEAVEGKRFRYYRSGQILVARAVETGAFDGVSSTVLTVPGRAWSASPQRWVGRLLYDPQYSVTSFASIGQMPARYYIASNTADTLTVANTYPPADALGASSNSNTWYIFEQPYREYVLDMAKTKSFLPIERPALDQYDHPFNFLRYEA